MERKKITFDSFIRGAIGCVLVVGILMLVERLSGVLLPFFIAWLIAYMVYPLVKFFQYKLKLKSRIVSILCALFLITVVGVSLFYLLVPPMISEISRMNDLLVTYLTNGAGNNVPQNLSEFIHENIDLQALNRILSEENILAAIKDTVPRMWALLAESLNILLQHCIVLKDSTDITVPIRGILWLMETQQIAVGIGQVTLVAQPQVQLPDKLCPAHVHPFTVIGSISHVTVVRVAHAVHKLVCNGFPAAERGVVPVEIPVCHCPNVSTSQSAIGWTALSQAECLF